MVFGMAVALEDFEPLTNRDGPIEVIAEDGQGITHAPSGIAKADPPGLAKVQSLRDISLVLLDEAVQETRRIPGQSILEVRRSNPGWVIVVDDSVEADPGPGVGTRGA